MQKFSKRKILLLGMEIEIFTTNGVWSETGLWRGLTEELGYELVQLHYKMWKTNLAGQEVDPLEKILPLISNFIKNWLLIKLLKVNISFALPTRFITVARGSKITEVPHKEPSSLLGMPRSNNQLVKFALSSPWHGS